MDTNLKNAISAMRKDIAELEKEQKTIKPQRKTVYFTGERTMGPFEARCKASDNKERLRILYAAYNLLRGKGFDKTEKSAKPIELDQYFDENGVWLNYDLSGMHPLFVDISDIARTLQKYGFDFKNYEEKKDRWGYPFKGVSFEKYEEVVYIGK